MANLIFDKAQIETAIDKIVDRTMRMDMTWDWPCGVAYYGICEAYEVTKNERYLQLVKDRVDEYIELESRINAMPCKAVKNFAAYGEYNLNKCLMTAEPEAAARHVEKLNELYGDILSIYRSEPFFIEVMPKNVDKATSLDRMLETVGLTREDAICCGDGFNDISMIKYAGVGVAMANAQEEVKKSADFITDSNDEDGIVKVIDTFVLNQENA